LGVTTIIVTHNIEEAAFLGRQVLVLGRPPNEDSAVIDNPGAGQAGWRSSPGFVEVTQALRERLARDGDQEGGRQ
jgi:NitT/TauT family transport system ATP-binding protein